MTRPALRALVVLALAASPLPAQSNPTLRRAVAAYGALEYGEAVGLARAALRERLVAAEQERAYEILGFGYAALDSAKQATEAFKQLLLLDPGRELDPDRISPKITTLFALALGQVLVVRRFEMDSAEFVAGAGAAPFRVSVTRPARLKVRVAGAGGDVALGATSGDGTELLRWNGLMANGLPAATGSYRVIVEAAAGRDSYAASFPLRVVAGTVDTLPHLVSLPGYAPMPETVVPPRSWRPFAIAAIATAAVAGGTLALQNGRLGGGARRELGVSVGGSLLVGMLATMKRPAPIRPEANIRYNALLREQLARRNAEVAAENATRRRQVKLTVLPPTAARQAPGAR
ncbi:MAG TPA: hypothetical protein VNA89_05140 [Gemmatimonadaceae bacterium]|nr:hypothetical protein [Gemmatimonadaceae bacterium]